MRTLAVLLAGALSLAGSTARALEPESPPVPLDPVISCGNREPAIAALPSGGFVAAWNNGGTLSTRRLDAHGAPSASEVTLTNGHPTGQRLVAFPDGGFAILWFDTDRAQVLARFVEVPGAGSAEVVVAGAGAAPGSGFGGLDATVGPSGTLAVVWTDGETVFLRELRRDGTFVTEPFVVEAYFHVLGYRTAAFTPVLLLGHDGAFRVFWVAGLGAPSVDFDGNIDGRRVKVAAGGGYEQPVAISTGGGGHDLAGAMAGDGTYLLVWGGFHSIPIDPPPAGIQGPIVAARLFAANDAPLQPTVRVDEGAFLPSGGMSVVARPSGGFVVAWHTDPDDGVDGFPRGLAREVSVGGTPSDAPVELEPFGAELGPEGQATPDLAFAPSGRLVAVWQRVLDPRVLPFVCPGERIHARAFTSDVCGEPGTCVGDGRFAVTVDWSDPRRGIAGTGHGASLTADAAVFWFFAPDNLEVIAKVVDGRTLNGRFWFFFAGLTDLGLHVEVVDRQTGARRTYDSPPGTFASVADTSALPGGGGAASLAAASRAPAATPTFFTSFPSAGPCTLTGLPVVIRPGLCLAGRRFEVEAQWRVGAGHQGSAQGVPIGDGSGGLWFFGPDNVELVVKVVDGRALNGSFWIFYGALTDVEYDLVVRRTEDGAEWHHHNPAGHPGSGADVKPF